VLKKGFDYTIGKKPEALLGAATNDSIPENKSIAYMVNKGYNKNGLSPEEFLMDYQNKGIPNGEVKYMQISDCLNGFKRGHAEITAKLSNGAKCYGTVEVYYKNGTFFQIMVIYRSLLKAKLEEKLTDEILNSFEILS
jgi:hypothetical protein